MYVGYIYRIGHQYPTLTLDSRISLEGGSLSGLSAGLGRNEQLNKDTMGALDAMVHAARTQFFSKNISIRAGGLANFGSQKCASSGSDEDHKL
jgi:hypothetical protein